MGRAAPWARATNDIKKPQSESCKKLDFRVLYNKTETFHVSVTHFILMLAIVQNKFQRANKNKINHINDNYLNFEVSLHFLGIWPTVRRSGSRLVSYPLKHRGSQAWLGLQKLFAVPKTPAGNTLPFSKSSLCH